MIAMSVNKAGTEPVLDMSFHTPIVYIFAVLEVNFAIITASIPIFWPAIATLASNKIFVVNEVQIHVEHVTRNDSFDSNAGGISLSDRKITSSGGDSKMGVITTISDQMPRKSGEKSSPINHYHKSESKHCLICRPNNGHGPRRSPQSRFTTTPIPHSEQREPEFKKPDAERGRRLVHGDGQGEFTRTGDDHGPKNIDSV